ncbi:hypothetical protein Tco_1326699 [Tanacetum coccineum]
MSTDPRNNGPPRGAMLDQENIYYTATHTMSDMRSQPASSRATQLCPTWPGESPLSLIGTVDEFPRLGPLWQAVSRRSTASLPQHTHAGSFDPYIDQQVIVIDMIMIDVNHVRLQHRA